MLIQKMSEVTGGRVQHVDLPCVSIPVLCFHVFLDEENVVLACVLPQELDGSDPCAGVFLEQAKVVGHLPGPLRLGGPASRWAATSAGKQVSKKCLQIAHDFGPQ